MKVESAKRRPMIAREFVETVRRDQFATALAQLCSERGFASVTVADVTNRAGMSRATFYQLFTGCDDCFVFLVETAAEELEAVVRGGRSPASDSDDQILGATQAAFRWLAENETRAWVLLIDAQGGPLDARRAQLRLFDSLAGFLALARNRDAVPASDALEQMLLGGTVTVLRRLAVDGEIELAPRYALELAMLMTRMPLAGT